MFRRYPLYSDLLPVLMQNPKGQIVHCPTCGKEVPWKKSENFKPFCSERCKLIDLGEWVMEEKVIPGETMLSEDDLHDPE